MYTIIFIVFILVLLLVGGIIYYLRKILFLEKKLRELEKSLPRFPDLLGKPTLRAAPRGRGKKQIIF